MRTMQVIWREVIDGSRPRPGRWTWLLPVGIYLGLSTTGLMWGLPNVVSWSNDDIAPGTVLRVGEYYWTSSHKYPYLQMIIDRALYEPYLALERARGHIQPDCTPVRRCLDDRIRQHGALILISRLRSLAMGLGVILLTGAIAWTAFGAGAAFWAALLASVNETLTFFAKQGNLDVPYSFWFMASVWVYLRIMNGAGPLAWLAFGCLAGAALATKESIIGAYPLMCVAMLWRTLRGGSPDKAEEQPLESPGWRHRVAQLGAMTAGLIAVYGLAMNALFNRPGLVQHLRHWLAGDGIDPYNNDFAGPLWFAAEVWRAAGFGSGWPLLAALLFGCTVTLLSRDTRHGAILVALPILSYVCFTIIPIRFVFSRFLLPVYLLLACVAAPTLARAWQRVGEGRSLRPRTRFAWALAWTSILAYSAVYSLNVGLAMRVDTRLLAEGWLREHLAPDTQVVGLGREGTMPRLELLGLDDEWVDWRRLPPYIEPGKWDDDERDDDEVQALAQMMLAADESRITPPEAAPDWLVLSSRSMPSPGEPGSGLWSALRSGSAGYQLRWDSSFQAPTQESYDDRPSPLGAWLPGLIVEPRVSPRIWILQRDP